ncbi:MAG TPA: hypothetical protein VEU52_04110 [Candidatus Limnocylindrales bacterium]|nr:hypothetical protein [Candidatus Limnocylindrales bacterium]
MRRISLEKSNDPRFVFAGRLPERCGVAGAFDSPRYLHLDCGDEKYPYHPFQ